MCDVGINFLINTASLAARAKLPKDVVSGLINPIGNTVGICVLHPPLCVSRISLTSIQTWTLPVMVIFVLRMVYGYFYATLSMRMVQVCIEINCDQKSFEIEIKK